MSEQDPLIRRLADANPVPEHAVDGAGDSPSATRLLARLMVGSERVASSWTRRRRRAAVAAAALLVGLAAAGFIVRAAGRSPATATELLRRTATVAESQPPPGGRGPYVYSSIMSNHPFTSGEAGQVWTAILPTVEETWISPDGSGRIRSETGDPLFLGPRDRDRWLAAGSPPFEAGVIDETFPAGSLVYEDSRDLPTAPGELLDVLRGQVAGEDLPEEVAIFQRIGELLAAGDATPDLRASLYRVAARLPGIQLVGDVTDPLGRPGVGVAITHGESGSRVQILMVFDQSSSALLAQEHVLLEEASWVDARPNTRIAFTAFLSVGRASSVQQVPGS